MSMAYLGTRFEIHGGGADLIFPHHESELAQSEGATGDRPFVEWWTHAGMLYYDDEKMSKSLGNLVLVRDLLRSYSGRRDPPLPRLAPLPLRGPLHRGRPRAPRQMPLPSCARPPCMPRSSRPPIRRVPTPAASRRSWPTTARRFLAAMDDDLDTPARHARARGARQARAQRGRPRRRRAGRLDGPRARRPHSRAAPGGGARGGGQHDGGMTGVPDDDLVPVSVRLGEVVPPGGSGGLDASADLGGGPRHAGGAAHRAGLVRHRATERERARPSRPPISSPSRSRLERRPPELRRSVRPGPRPQHLGPACSPRWWSSSSAW